jgi:hypothetical protein
MVCQTVEHSRQRNKKKFHLGVCLVIPASFKALFETCFEALGMKNGTLVTLNFAHTSISALLFRLTYFFSCFTSDRFLAVPKVTRNLMMVAISTMWRDFCRRPLPNEPSRCRSAKEDKVKFEGVMPPHECRTVCGVLEDKVKSFGCPPMYSSLPRSPRYEGYFQF